MSGRSKNHTLKGGTSPYSLSMGVPPGGDLLHCAVFSATCLAVLLGTKNKCAHAALVKTVVKLRDKLMERWYTVQWCCQLLQSVAKSRAEFYFVQRFAQQKNCETTHVTLQFSSNLSRNGIARQVSEKIAQCNRALSEIDMVSSNFDCMGRKLHAIAKVCTGL